MRRTSRWTRPSSARSVVRTADDSWGAFTPRVVLDYVPNDNTLLYVSASRGFKSGGFNTFGDVSQPVNLFDPEFVWNYEAGLKASFLESGAATGRHRLLLRLHEPAADPFSNQSSNRSEISQGRECGVRGHPRRRAGCRGHSLSGPETEGLGDLARCQVRALHEHRSDLPRAG